MNLHYEDETVKLWHGDCIEVMRTLPDSSVDSVVCDPPYGLANTDPAHVAETITRWVNGDRDYLPTGAGFMGKAWDAFVPPVAVWDDCLRVLKPGGHVLTFAGTRTMDLMTLGLRLAGFEIRDSIAWLYATGFPKSLDVSKAIDKAAGVERQVLSEGAAVKRMIPGADQNATGSWIKDNGREYVPTVTAAATPEAEQWQGWGTALKPAFEPIVVARKPLAGTVAANVLAHGTGALNIDGCRVGLDGEKPPSGSGRSVQRTSMEGGVMHGLGAPIETNPAGRWPANVVLDESQAAALDEMSGELTSGKGPIRERAMTSKGYKGGGLGQRKAEDHDFTDQLSPNYGDSGGASRFFYVAKADASERVRLNGTAHPTVKPLALMRWLVRLVTPHGGTVLEPFAGSGTTVEACVLEGFDCIAIEREETYLPLIKQRIHRRRDPVEAVKSAGEDGGLFDLLGEGA